MAKQFCEAPEEPGEVQTMSLSGRFYLAHLLTGLGLIIPLNLFERDVDITGTINQITYRGTDNQDHIKSDSFTIRKLGVGLCSEWAISVGGSFTNLANGLSCFVSIDGTITITPK